jgi:hypothetical protein
VPHQTVAELLAELAAIEHLIVRAEYRAQDAVAAIDDEGMMRVAKELRDLRGKLANLKAQLAGRSVPA